MRKGPLPGDTFGPRMEGVSIRRLRLKQGWSQSELARRAGCSTRTVQAWEQGSRWPGGIAAAHLAQLLGTPETAADPAQVASLRQERQANASIFLSDDRYGALGDFMSPWAPAAATRVSARDPAWPRLPDKDGYKRWLYKLTPEWRSAYPEIGPQAVCLVLHWDGRRFACSAPNEKGYAELAGSILAETRE